MSQPTNAQPHSSRDEEEFDKTDDEIRAELAIVQQRANEAMKKAQEEYEQALSNALENDDPVAKLAAVYPPPAGKSSGVLYQEAVDWVNAVWENASTDASECERAFATLVDLMIAYERRRVEEGGCPARRGYTNALALNLWYDAEKAWRRAHKDEKVLFQYTGTDSSDDEDDEDGVGGIVSDDEDESEDGSAGSDSEVRQRRRRQAPPHPRRSRPLNHRAMMRMRATFLLTKRMLELSVLRSPSKTV